MFTQKENEAAQRQERAFINQCTAYRQLLTDNSLPLSVDLEELKAALRNQLFAKLLTVDAGLQMRWEMLRSEEAQQKLVADTVDLTGYEVVTQIADALKPLNLGWERMMLRSGGSSINPVREGLSLIGFCANFELDLVQWLDTRTFSWEGNEHVLNYFKTLGQQLQIVRSLARKTHRSHADLYSSLVFLNNYYTADSQTGEIEPNEHLIFQQVLPQLKSAGALAKFPNI